MTTPPTNLEPGAAAPVVVTKPGPPRAVILGGLVLGISAVAAAGFYFMQQNQQGANVDAGGDVPPPSIPTRPAKPIPTGVPKKPTESANDIAKRQAAQALGAMGGRRINLTTSFDNVPKSLGGTGERVYPATPKPAPDNGGKVKPIVQGQLPAGLRSDPFVTRLFVPISRQYAYSLAVPYRLAPPAQPIAPPTPIDIPVELRLGPLPYVPRRVAGYLEFGGVSAILETGAFGNGAIDIVQPGATVNSGIQGIPKLTVESISSTEMVLRAEDGRSAKVALSGVPGGVANPQAPGDPPGGGGPPPGIPGGRGGRGGGGAAIGL